MSIEQQDKSGASKSVSAKLKAFKLDQKELPKDLKLRHEYMIQLKETKDLMY